MPYVAPSQAFIQTNLTTHNLVGAPADAIVSRPGHELWQGVHNANITVLVRKLCENFYHYGQNNGWTWAGFGRNNVAGDPTATGLPLVSDPTVVSTNCGGFNASVRQIASKVLGVGDDQFQGDACADQFMTRPGTTGIDVNWPGNVRTFDQDFDTLCCYSFRGHSWSKIVTTGVLYDASTNCMDFHSKNDLIWATLKDLGTAGWHTFDAVPNPEYVPGDPPYAKVRVDYLQANAALLPTGGMHRITRAFVAGLPTHNDPTNHWPNSIVVSVYDLPEAMRRAAGVY